MEYIQHVRHTRRSMDSGKPDSFTESDADVLRMVVAARDSEIAELKQRLQAVLNHRDQLELRIERQEMELLQLRRARSGFKVSPKPFVPRDRKN